MMTDTLRAKTAQNKKSGSPGPDRSRGKLAALQMEVYLRIEYSKRNDLSRKKIGGTVSDSDYAQELAGFEGGF